MVAPPATRALLVPPAVNVPTVVAEEVAANIPERVTESPAVAVERIVPFLVQ